MRIIVSSEAEKDLMERFIDVLNAGDVISNDIQKLDNECPDGKTNQPSLDYDEYTFVEKAFLNCHVDVGNVRPIETEDNIITGICIECGQETEGTIDGDDVSYDEYLDYKKQKDGWRCDSCMNMGGE